MGIAELRPEMGLQFTGGSPLPAPLQILKFLPWLKRSKSRPHSLAQAQATQAGLDPAQREILRVGRQPLRWRKSCSNARGQKYIQRSKVRR